IMGLGGCSGIDILSILKKGRQNVEHFSVNLTAERAEGEIPSLFTKVHAHFTLNGDLDSEKVKRAIELSLEKYCSVAKTIESSAEITFSYTVNTVDYA
ncbi:MAG: OsmC family protein, partial [Bacteroidota bacterium]